MLLKRLDRLFMLVLRRSIAVMCVTFGDLLPLNDFLFLLCPLLYFMHLLPNLHLSLLPLLD